PPRGGAHRAWRAVRRPHSAGGFRRRGPFHLAHDRRRRRRFHLHRRADQPRARHRPLHEARTATMPGLLILTIVMTVGWAWWSSARAAAERAEDLGRHACHAAGV